MNTEQTLYKLQTWFSPSYPVGAYSYSHGLEYAHEAGLITNKDEAIEWISDIICCGNGFADGVFLARSHGAVNASDEVEIARVAEYAIAFGGTSELRLESQAQGQAFLKMLEAIEGDEVTKPLTDARKGPFAYPVVAGVAAATLNMPCETVLGAYLHGFVANLASALTRIIPLGQTDGQRIIAALQSTVDKTAGKALSTPLEELTTSTLMVDLTSMRHENQYTRLFRS